MPLRATLLSPSTKDLISRRAAFVGSLLTGAAYAALLIWLLLKLT